MPTSLKTKLSLVPDLAAWFVCRRFWDTSDLNRVTSAIADARPSTVLDAILAGINWAYRPKSPLARHSSALDRLKPVLNELPPDTRAYLLGEAKATQADAKKHRERVRRFLLGSKPRVRT